MMGKLKSHRETKDSGLVWLGRIPKHWTILRAKWLFQCVDIRSSTGQEELLTVSSKRGVVPRSSESVTMFKAASYVGYKLCWPKDLVINSLWAWGYGLGVSRHHGIISSAYGVYRLRKLYNEYFDYIHKLVRSVPFNWELRVRSKGIWISRLQLTDESFLNISIPLPQPEEQTAIVRFLDFVDRHIQCCICAKQRLIDLFKEYRKSIIRNAVTRGLDPRVRLKYSGLEWLGNVPEHWKIERLKSSMQNIIEQANEQRDADLYVAMEHVESWTGRLTISSDDVVFESQVKCFHPSDILFGKLRPYLAKVTRPRQNGVCVGEFLVLRRTHANIDPCYMEYLLRSKPIIDEINRSTYGARMPRANWSFIGRLAIPVPPASEQSSIAEFLDRATADLDAAVFSVQREVSLLREFRTRLISDVVTGKLDVREAADNVQVGSESSESPGTSADPVDESVNVANIKVEEGRTWH